MTDVVTSADGTRIVYDRYGDGPPVVSVGGAVVAVSDRRGRGESVAAGPVTGWAAADMARALADFLPR